MSVFFTGLSLRGIFLSIFFLCTCLNSDPGDPSLKAGFLNVVQDSQFWVISEMSHRKLMSQGGLVQVPLSRSALFPVTQDTVLSTESDARHPVLKGSFWSHLLCRTWIPSHFWVLSLAGLRLQPPFTLYFSSLSIPKRSLPYLWVWLCNFILKT